MGIKHTTDIDDVFMQPSGTPLFTKDQITEHSDVLVKLLRFILVENNVTIEEYTNKFRVYALNVLRLHPTKVNSQKRNIYNAMISDHISWKKFVEIIVYILGFNITDLYIELSKGDDFTTKSYRLSEACISEKDDN